MVVVGSFGPIGTGTPFECEHDVSNDRLALQIGETARSLLVRRKIQKRKTRRRRKMPHGIRSRFRKSHRHASKGPKGVHQDVRRQRPAGISVQSVQEQGSIVGVVLFERLFCRVVVVAAVVVTEGSFPRRALPPSVGPSVVPSSSPPDCRRVFLGDAPGPRFRQASGVRSRSRSRSSSVRTSTRPTRRRGGVVVDVVRQIGVRTIHHRGRFSRRLSIVGVHVSQGHDAHGVNEFEGLSEGFEFGRGCDVGHGEETAGVGEGVGGGCVVGVAVGKAGDEATAPSPRTVVLFAVVAVFLRSEVPRGRRRHRNGHRRTRRQMISRATRGHQFRHVVRSRRVAAAAAGDRRSILFRQGPAARRRHALPPFPRNEDVAPQKGGVFRLSLETGAGQSRFGGEESDDEMEGVFSSRRGGIGRRDRDREGETEDVGGSVVVERGSIPDELIEAGCHSPQSLRDVFLIVSFAIAVAIVVVLLLLRFVQVDFVVVLRRCHRPRRRRQNETFRRSVPRIHEENRHVEGQRSVRDRRAVFRRRRLFRPLLRRLRVRPTRSVIASPSPLRRTKEEGTGAQADVEGTGLGSLEGAQFVGEEAELTVDGADHEDFGSFGGGGGHGGWVAGWLGGCDGCV
mmetsp:Transcript_6956/g.13348  ORF Transcript_6956/g.13348 Transcript_6956/m.13348 type:complete len:624 (-) Transcript_6956:40-1911(-)